MEDCKKNNDEERRKLTKNIFGERRTKKIEQNELANVLNTGPTLTRRNEPKPNQNYEHKSSNL